ncbi:MULTISPECIES: ABC transporter ATP-binding protein [Aliivibrio]|uniref:ABC transporter ATP-binding protein n=1 Tax=Aliivibrio logei 5S-186 TaxID=626086 RepID=A0ABX3AVM3_ALILO|nr:ABC transporter ATP-binding protein [Aliivibrio logei]OEF11947.1 ABC transporter ATP-binding protein [Aliivibrio logei 5S-186]
MTSLVHVKHVSKQYSDSSQQAINDISFDLNAGQVLGLLGHNGAGKSTLINALLGAHRYQGNIRINGLHPIDQHAELMQHLAYISDVNVLPEWMSVKQLLKYTSGIHPSFDIDKATAVLANTNIQLKNTIKSLSKGMKVQVHLAIVIATNTKVLILDEPTLGLDLLYRDTFYQHLTSWFNAGERCLIIASHEVSEIEHLLTDVLILKQGRIVKQETMNNIPQGTLAELFITLQKESI